eukprot:613939-Pleurochrysis_carterae.AAC.1
MFGLHGARPTQSSPHACHAIRFLGDRLDPLRIDRSQFVDPALVEFCESDGSEEREDEPVCMEEEQGGAGGKAGTSTCLRLETAAHCARPP